MASYVAKKANQPPETVVGAEGTAKRNIIRKGGAPRERKGDISGKSIDDGSMYTDGAALDSSDPNYNSEEEAYFVKVPIVSALHRREIAKSRYTLTQYKKAVQPIIEEFFESFDANEVANSLQEIDALEYSYEFVKRLINGAIDREDSHREQVSRLLSELYPDLLSSNMIGKGFERLFEIIDEIEIDAPKSPAILAAFIARAVIDEVLPPSFLKDNVVCNLGGEIIEHATLMLSRDHSGAKLEKIWGPGDGRPVEEMKVAVDQLVEEYLLSSDLSEAERCLMELRAPKFFHEVVKRAVTIAMDKSEEDQMRLSQLFAYLASSQILTLSQAQQGFNRLFNLLSDLSLDVPKAKEILNGFVERAISDHVLPRDYVAPVSNA
eukprot:CAMPEP_0202965640 /NCGR_PEP_ID=MMETSP1396-20130829/9545_1 /ASSEMBLY_ACC=CAM_ASM_000872 /TAXON_ID= /ORGANISM="Pseudokeronopsis sp., Strain Brazil" /LENGTH=378 /DNA_ID=CAMNT_0049688419 /DNA_START=108 /DNA_END=1244 /DNA_ORIENTATION=-